MDAHAHSDINLWSQAKRKYISHRAFYTFLALPAIYICS